MRFDAAGTAISQSVPDQKCSATEHQRRESGSRFGSAIQYQLP
jgi:hypothetical protein